MKLSSARTRFLLEALFLVVVAAAAGFAHLRPLGIVLVMAIAWAVVAFVERSAARARAAERPERDGSFEDREEAPEDQVVVWPEPPASAAPAEAAEAAPPPSDVSVPGARRDQERGSEATRESKTSGEAQTTEEPAASDEPQARGEREATDEPQATRTPPKLETEAETEPQTQPQPEPEREPKTPSPAADLREKALEPEPEPEPERERQRLVLEPPRPAELRALEPPPELERVAEPEPRAPASDVLAFEPRAPVRPREWNVWELERIVREQEGRDVEKDEERSYLLVSLRQFANSDGILPLSFDPVVRESFGDLVGR